MWSRPKIHSSESQWRAIPEKHNYYQREKYINKINQIWLELTKLGLTNNTLG